MSNGSETSEIAEARRDVELAKADLRYRVRFASETSKRVMRSVVRQMKPALVIAAGLGALALTVGLVKLARLARRRRPNLWMPPAKPSLLRSVVRTILSSIAARIVARIVQNLPLAQLPAENPRQLPITVD